MSYCCEGGTAIWQTFLMESTKNLRAASKYFAFNFASSNFCCLLFTKFMLSSVVFIGVSLSSSNFCLGQNKFRTHSTFSSSSSVILVF